MSNTGTDIISRLPKFITIRYVPGTILNWLNELLEELSGEGLIPETKKEIGVVTVNDHWIDLPSDLRKIDSILHPTDRNHEYAYEIIDGQIHLTKERVKNQGSPDTATVFSASTVSGISAASSVDIAVDQYEKYLLHITGSTADVYTGNTYILAGNAASVAGVFAMTYMHKLSAALDATKISAAEFIQPDHYLLLRYTAGYTAMTAIGDAFPVDNKYALRITDAWCRYKAESMAMGYTSGEEMASYKHYQDVLATIQSEVLGKPGPVQGRFFPSFRQVR